MELEQVKAENEDGTNGMSPEETPSVMPDNRDFMAEQMEQMEGMIGMGAAVVSEAIEGRDIAKEKREFRDRCILDVWITLLNMGADPKTIYDKTASITAKLVTVREKLEESEAALMKAREEEE